MSEETHIRPPGPPPPPPVPSPAPPPPPVPPVPGVPHSTTPGRRRKNWLLPLVAAGAGLIFGLGGAFGWHLIQNATLTSSLKDERTTRTEAVTAAHTDIATAAKDFGTADAPDTAVLAYLRALEVGTVDAKFEAGLVKDGASTALLTSEAYAKVPFRVSGPVVTASQIDQAKGTATVTAAYHVGPDNELITDEFALHSEGGDWHLDDSAVVVVPVTVDRSGSVLIGGVDITASLTDTKGTMSGTVALLPGQYAAGFSEPSGFWGTEGSTVIVGTSAKPSGFDLATTVSKAVVDEVTATARNQLNAWLDECVASKLTGPTCSATVQEEGRYISNKMVYRVYAKDYPTVSITWVPETNTFSYRGIGVVATDGAAVGGGQTTRPIPLGYSGTLTWNGPGNMDMPMGIL